MSTASAAFGGEVGLSQRHAALLDELSSVLTSGSPVAGGAAKHTADSRQEADDEPLLEPCAQEYEAFYSYWRQVQAKQRSLDAAQRRSRWQWIDRVQEICVAACDELDTLLSHLVELDAKRQEVVMKTTTLHEKCEHMVQDQEQLSRKADLLAERLDIFESAKDVARVLDQGNAATSQPETFGTMLDQLDASIAFLEAHHDFCQAQAHAHQFEHLRNRACIYMRSALQKSLEKSASQVEQQLKERVDEGDGLVDVQALYTRFRAAAPNYSPMTSMLYRRIDVHETYLVTLEELEAFYATVRIRLISTPVTTQLQSMLNKDFNMQQLAPATRQASSYIFDISHFERQCFEAYFESRQPQEPLRTLLEAVADIFYKALRPVVLACDSVDFLREMADCLQMDILEPHQQGRTKRDLAPVLAAVFRLHKDVQEKLIFRVQMCIRNEIKGYQISSADLNYPDVFFALDPDRAEEPSAAAREGGAQEPPRGFQSGWFPTMQWTLEILAKIYRVLEMPTFQGLAQEAVDLCIASLKQASQMIGQRALPSTSGGLGPLVQLMDSQLFLVKHLLVLREQVAAFECDLVANEKYFNFSNVWEALHLKLPDGLLGILKPKLHMTQIDSKKDMEAELKAACELLITNLTAHLTQPLAAWNTQIDDFLKRAGSDRASLKDQPFMAPGHLEEIIGAFLSGVRERVPFAAAHIRLYLSASGASSGDRSSASLQSTAAILFKPVQKRLVDTWGRLEGLLEEQQLSATELERLGFLRPSKLGDLVDSLFNQTMEVPWPQLVEVVSRVPRAILGQGAAPPLQTTAGDSQSDQLVEADTVGVADGNAAEAVPPSHAQVTTEPGAGAAGEVDTSSGGAGPDAGE
jgi:hypothetical protein